MTEYPKVIRIGAMTVTVRSEAEERKWTGGVVSQPVTYIDAVELGVEETPIAPVEPAPVEKKSKKSKK